MIGKYFLDSHSSRDLVYNWAKPKGHDVELKDKIILPEFFGEKPRTSRKKLNYTTGMEMTPGFLGSQTLAFGT